MRRARWRGGGGWTRVGSKVDLPPHAPLAGARAYPRGEGEVAPAALGLAEHGDLRRGGPPGAAADDIAELDRGIPGRRALGQQGVERAAGVQLTLLGLVADHDEVG